MASPRYAQFSQTPTQYTLLNGGNEEVTFTYAALMVHIPATNVVLYPQVGCLWVSAKDSQGAYIPGTVILQDILVPGSDGMSRVGWNAADAIKAKLEINSDGVAFGDYNKRGLVVLNPNPTAAEIDEARRTSRTLWQEWKLEDARRTVAEYESRNEARKRANMGAVPASAEFVKASALLGEEFATHQQTAQHVLRDDFVEGPDDLESFVKAKIKTLVTRSKQITPEIAAAEVEAQLLADPEVVNLLTEKFDKRKRRQESP